MLLLVYADAYEYARTDFVQSLAHLRHQRQQCLQAIVSRQQQNDCDAEGREILLILQVLIYREEHVKFRIG